MALRLSEQATLDRQCADRIVQRPRQFWVLGLHQRLLREDRPLLEATKLVKGIAEVEADSRFPGLGLRGVAILTEGSFISLLLVGAIAGFDLLGSAAATAPGQHQQWDTDQNRCGGEER